MAVKTLEERKKQKKLTILLAIILLATFLVLYFGIFKKQNDAIMVGDGRPAEGNLDQSGAVTQSDVPVVPKQSAKALDEKLKKVDLNTDFLVNTILATLKIHGLIPVKKGATGRPNPFSAQ